jgi:hypothetical protein
MPRCAQAAARWATALTVVPAPYYKPPKRRCQPLRRPCPRRCAVGRGSDGCARAANRSRAGPPSTDHAAQATAPPAAATLDRSIRTSRRSVGRRHSRSRCCVLRVAAPPVPNGSPQRHRRRLRHDAPLRWPSLLSRPRRAAAVPSPGTAQRHRRPPTTASRCRGVGSRGRDGDFGIEKKSPRWAALSRHFGRRAAPCLCRLGPPRWSDAALAHSASLQAAAMGTPWRRVGKPQVRLAGQPAGLRWLGFTPFILCFYHLQFKFSAFCVILV